MIKANEALFRTLDFYCERRSDPVENSGSIRFVAGDNNARGSLQHLKAATKVEFGLHRALLQMEMRDTTYVALVGFDFDPHPIDAVEVQVNPGALVAILTELNVAPKATPVVIRNVVEAGDNSDPDYPGHDAPQIASLFPDVRLFQLREPMDADTAWRTFLVICTNECALGGSWIFDDLALELRALSDVGVSSLPYEALCRSMFDLDPRGLFMSLYRCIEATYAFESSRKLVKSLGLSISWQEVAIALEREMSWHPREANSLNLILTYAEQRDLQQLCACLNHDVGNDLVASASKAIYGLRNRIVHYRPGHDVVDVDSVDWNTLCILLVRIVFTVFLTAYGHIDQ